MSPSAFTEPPMTTNDGVVEERLSIAPPARPPLEGVLSYAPEAAPAPGVLIVPPHPQFAGNLDNNVVAALARRMALAGRPALRFNYRGVGGSGFADEDGVSAYDFWARAEAQGNWRPALADTLAAGRFLSRETPGATRGVHLVGYSFGALVGAAAAARFSSCLSCTCIATPWRRAYDFSAFHRLTVPILFLNGADDFVFDAGVFGAIRETMSAPTQHRVLAADHFFRGAEDDVAACALSHIATAETEAGASERETP